MNFIFSVENRCFYHAVLKTNLLAPKKYNNKVFSKTEYLFTCKKQYMCKGQTCRTLFMAIRNKKNPNQTDIHFS